MGPNPVAPIRHHRRRRRQRKTTFGGEPHAWGLLWCVSGVCVPMVLIWSMQTRYVIAFFLSPTTRVIKRPRGDLELDPATVTQLLLLRVRYDRHAQPTCKLEISKYFINLLSPSPPPLIPLNLLPPTIVFNWEHIRMRIHVQISNFGLNAIRIYATFRDFISYSCNRTGIVDYKKWTTWLISGVFVLKVCDWHICMIMS